MQKFRLHPSDTAILVWLLIVAVFFIGYILNIAKLLGMDINNPTIVMVVRVIGLVLPPLGSIVGYY
jgi:hypothetical protein